MGSLPIRGFLVDECGWWPPTDWLIPGLVGLVALTPDGKRLIVGWESNTITILLRLNAM
jgi:hypothetical protein